MRRNVLTSVLVATLLIVGAGFIYAKERTTEYHLPDIRDDFCGVEIGFQNCKCAFHNDLCDSAGMNQDQAEVYVNDEYRAWVKDQIRDFAQSCVDQNGKYNQTKRSCAICEGGAWQGDRCVENAAQIDGPFNADCSLTNEFNRDWEKYSDFDTRINVRDASFEVREYNRVLDEIADKITEAENLEYQMEVDRHIRLEMKEYKNAIVNNLRANLAKSIIRLSWLTYNTVKGAKGPGESYSKVFTEESTIKQIGAAMKFVQSGVPQGSLAEIDTNSRVGQIKSGAWNATLEALESGGDPKAIAIQVYTDAVQTAGKPNVPGLEFTDEELAVLKEQNETNNALDELIADSYKENALRRRQVLVLREQIENLYVELQEWKEKEYNRVQASLVDQCNTGGR